ncbi:hypothetical protein [Vitreoscilla filiformis]|uniref:hypothetical protein n=1 Tax=Vitreoscilla filiformis TaxID=63 RepID=UPI0012FD3923|nr:hypothetical protein [Vitreoscilla filiformis]
MDWDEAHATCYIAAFNAAANWPVSIRRAIVDCLRVAVETAASFDTGKTALLRAADAALPACEAQS